MTTMTKPAQPSEFVLSLDGHGITTTSGEITDAARRAFWRNADVYEEAAQSRTAAGNAARSRAVAASAEAVDA